MMALAAGGWGRSPQEKKTPGGRVGRPKVATAMPAIIPSPWREKARVRRNAVRPPNVATQEEHP